MKYRLKLKVCGMRYPQNIKELVMLKPDYMGFIFYSKSPRYMPGDLAPNVAYELSRQIPKVGVFVNESVDEIVQQALAYNINLLQLHGKESPDECAALKEKGFCIIKAFGVDDNFSFNELNPYEPVVDYFLFDTKGANYGGNGIRFNWQVLNNYPNTKPLFLSGGIGLEDLEDIYKLEGLSLHAIDVNSRFELSPGLKDVGKVKQLIEKLRSLGN